MMSDTVEATGELDRLLSMLESIIQPSQAGQDVTTPQANGQTPRAPVSQATVPQNVTEAGDAIEAVLASPARATAVRSLRDSPEIEAFRQALVDGLIRADTVNKLLGLINEIVGQLIK